MCSPKVDIQTNIGPDFSMMLAFQLRPGSNGFTCGKLFIGYINFGTESGTKSKFGTHKELIVLNTLKYKYFVNRSRDVSRDHFSKSLK